MCAKEKEPIKYELRQLYDLPLDQIETNPDQPRKHFDPDGIKDLSEFIKTKGVLFPILVTEHDGKILLVAGERRLRASKEAGLKSIPAIFTDGDVEEISLIENTQRENLTAIEEAEAVARLVEQRGYKDKDLIPILGKAKSTISEIKSLTKLPDVIKDECRSQRTWSRSILVEIAKKPSENEMIKLFEEVKKKDLKGDELISITRQGGKHNEKPLVLVNKINALHISFSKFDPTLLDEKHSKEIRESLQKLKVELEKLLE